MDGDQAWDDTSNSRDHTKSLLRRILAFVVRFALQLAGVVLIAEFYFELRPCFRLIAYVGSIGDAVSCAAMPILYMRHYGPFFETTQYLAPFSVLALGLALSAPQTGPRGHARPSNGETGDDAIAVTNSEKRRFPRVPARIIRLAVEFGAVILIVELYFSSFLCVRFIARLDSMRDVFGCIARPHLYMEPIIDSREYVPLFDTLQYFLPLSTLGLLLTVWWVTNHRRR